MADILPFKPVSLHERARRKTLCRNGHHKWEISQRKQFDVKQGRLVTIRRCIRCGVEKTELR